MQIPCPNSNYNVDTFFFFVFISIWKCLWNIWEIPISLVQSKIGFLEKMDLGESVAELPGPGSCSGQCPVKVLLLWCWDELWEWQFPATSAHKAEKLLGARAEWCLWSLWEGSVLKLKHLHTHCCPFCAASSTGIGSQVQLKKKLIKCAGLVQEACLHAGARGA